MPSPVTASAGLPPDNDGQEACFFYSVMGNTEFSTRWVLRTTHFSSLNSSLVCLVSLEPTKTTAYDNANVCYTTQQRPTVSPHPFFWQSGSNPDYCHPSVYVAMTTEETKLDQDRIHVIDCRAEVHQTWTDFRHCLYTFPCWLLHRPFILSLSVCVQMWCSDAVIGLMLNHLYNLD